MGHPRPIGTAVVPPSAPPLADEDPTARLPGSSPGSAPVDGHPPRSPPCDHSNRESTDNAPPPPDQCPRTPPGSPAPAPAPPRAYAPSWESPPQYRGTAGSPHPPETPPTAARTPGSHDKPAGCQGHSRLPARQPGDRSPGCAPHQGGSR